MMDRKMKDFEEEEEYNPYEVEAETEKCPIGFDLLLRLSQCGVSSRMGLVDKGSPNAYRQLAVLGYTKAIENGHVVTPDGYALLAKWSQKLRTI